MRISRAKKLPEQKKLPKIHFIDDKDDAYCGAVSIGPTIRVIGQWDAPNMCKECVEQVQVRRARGNPRPCLFTHEAS
jgi:hypothetical protein